MRSKELELEQAQEACRKLQWLKQQCDEKHTAALRERDNIITQLHTTLHIRSKETEVNINTPIIYSCLAVVVFLNINSNDLS